MRILIKKREDGWYARFGVGNAWKMPAGEWLPLMNTADSAAGITDNLLKQFPGCNVFTICALGEDLVQ
jgi:hypothetical protein